MRLVRIGVLCALLLLVPLAALAGEWVVTVDQSGFSPAELTIRKGDVVRWEWQAGSHTVTDGDPENLPEAGARFDAPVDAQNRELAITFQETGTFAYFSRTDTDVKGAIVVEEVTTVNTRTWSWIKRAFEDQSSANK